MKNCSVDGCARTAKRQGMCKMHALRAWRYGDPLRTSKGIVGAAPTKFYGVSSEKRFWHHVAVNEGGCWEWTGAINTNGYGYFKTGKGMQHTHRVAWELCRGPIPEGQWVLHRCDNRLCVWPGHLFLGTHQDNVDDKVAKNRQSRLQGERHPRARLTEEQVRAIRERRIEGESPSLLASEYGITPSAIANIVARRLWSHVV